MIICVKHIDKFDSSCSVCLAGQGIFIQTGQPSPGNTVRSHRCDHLSEDEIPGSRRVALNLTHTKRWYDCGKGHGPQCLCMGKCGPKCLDFTVENANNQPENNQPEKNREIEKYQPKVKHEETEILTANIPYKRHLAFHIYPSSGKSVWRRAVDQLKLRWHLFDGIKAIAVVQGEGLDDITEVQAAFTGMDADVFALENNPELREVASWQLLWNRILPNVGENDYAFYGHAKGVSRHVDTGCMTHQWASLLYSLNLDYWPEIHHLLQKHAIVGAFKKIGHGFGVHLGRWHFSGTFYWLKLSDFKLRYQESKPPNIWFGTESWPGTAYEPSEAGSIFGEGRVSELNLYSSGYWRGVLLPRYYEWLKQRRNQQQHQQHEMI
jgi:hypothetical protein